MTEDLTFDNPGGGKETDHRWSDAVGAGRDAARACPVGWIAPTAADWLELSNALDGTGDKPSVIARLKLADGDWWTDTDVPFREGAAWMVHFGDSGKIRFNPVRKDAVGKLRCVESGTLPKSGFADSAAKISAFFEKGSPKENVPVSRCAGGVFVDFRDGREYGCAKIGEQVWMSENLDFGPLRAGRLNFPI